MVQSRCLHRRSWRETPQVPSVQHLVFVCVILGFLPLPAQQLCTFRTQDILAIWYNVHLEHKNMACRQRRLDCEQSLRGGESFARAPNQYIHFGSTLTAVHTAVHSGSCCESTQHVLHSHDTHQNMLRSSATSCFMYKSAAWSAAGMPPSLIKEMLKLWTGARHT